MEATLGEWGDWSARTNLLLKIIQKTRVRDTHAREVTDPSLSIYDMY